MILPSGILVIGKSICVYGYGFVEIKLRGVMDTAESDSAVLLVPLIQKLGTVVLMAPRSLAQ